MDRDLAGRGPCNVHAAQQRAGLQRRAGRADDSRGSAVGNGPRHEQAEQHDQRDPTDRPAGARVTVTGDAPTNARAGQWITLRSDAFASKTNVNGIPTIRAQVLVNGKYSVKATIRRGLKPTTYAIAGSFHGKALAQVAWMKVS